MNLKLLTPTKKVTIGSDPEVFLCTPRGIPTPACGLIGGTKANPIPVRGGTLQEDNVMAELGHPPALTADAFVKSINTVQRSLAKIAKSYGLEVSTRASYDFPMYELIAHTQAMEFGCEPDYNAYTLEQNPTPNIDSTLRTCAGHIHLGFESKCDDYMEMSGKVVEYLDWIVGLWTVTVDPDNARRERYGKAGAFRPKRYGVEYRVPSNFWLKNDSLKRMIFNRVRLAYGLAQSNAEKPEASKIIDAINTHNIPACNELMGRYRA